MRGRVGRLRWWRRQQRLAQYIFYRYRCLCGRGKAANKVRLQIEAIGAADTLEVGDVAAVQAAVDAYNALSPLEKRLVPAPSLKALEDMAAAINTNAQTAADISAQLLKLPAAADVDTDAEEAQVNNARNAYDKLTDAQKTWVSPPHSNIWLRLNQISAPILPVPKLLLMPWPPCRPTIS